MNPPIAFEDVRRGDIDMIPAAAKGDPAWPVALLFPLQGDWTEEDYLALDTNRMVEFVDGCLEILPMPTSPVCGRRKPVKKKNAGRKKTPRKRKSS
jgi:hypothetical protein